MNKITFDTRLNSGQLLKFERYLLNGCYKFKQKNIATDVYRFKVETGNPTNAFWIGCNLTEITNNKF